MSDAFDPETGEIIIPEKSPIGPMPPEIAAAIVNVMGKIRRLGKEGQNTFQRYQFTSVDQFYEAVGPLMAESGIFTMVYESVMDISERKTTTDRGETKMSVWLSAIYDVYIYHETGKFYGPIARSTQVTASGAQSYASAMSFVEKYFLRSLFKIPTGDKDAEEDQKHELPHGRSAPRPPNPTQSRVPQYLSDAQADKLLGMIKECGKGTWDQFAKEFGIDRLSAIPANKYDGCIAWLSGRLQAQSSAKATVAPPNPGKPASAPPQPAQSASINLYAFRSALRAAATQDDINAMWEREVEARKPPLSDDEADEAQAILREESSRFWTTDEV
jgi:hypothetical protein